MHGSLLINLSHYYYLTLEYIIYVYRTNIIILTLHLRTIYTNIKTYVYNLIFKYNRNNSLIRNSQKIGLVQPNLIYDCTYALQLMYTTHNVQHNRNIALHQLTRIVCLINNSTVPIKLNRPSFLLFNMSRHEWSIKK